MLDLRFIQSRMQHEPELEHDKLEQQQGCYKQVEGEQACNLSVSGHKPV